MMRNKPVHGRGAFFVLSVFALTGGIQAAQAASISWDKQGAFEVCLEKQLNDWVNAKAALIINEDPAAGDIDDMDVALWAVSALERCEAQAGQSNQTSEHRFSRYMAHWREHIHTIAQTVRQRARVD